eukprot:Selendium_serpulae@DN6268_c0_g1_i1.p1
MGLADSVEGYLTSMGLLRLLLPTIAINGGLVHFTTIIHWRLTHNEKIFFGHHASQLAILGCLSVAWVQGHSHVALPSNEPNGHCNLISTNVFPAPVMPVWKNRQLHMVPCSAIGSNPWYTSLFEGFAYKLQSIIFALVLLFVCTEGFLGIEFPRWVGTFTTVDLWCFSYGSFVGWLFLRYFYFYAPTNSRGDPSATFELTKVFFPQSSWPFFSPVFNQIHSFAAKLSIFRLKPTAPVPRANANPVLPLAGPDIGDPNLTVEQRCLRQKGMEILKHHINHPTTKNAAQTQQPLSTVEPENETEMSSQPMGEVYAHNRADDGFSQQ